FGCDEIDQDADRERAAAETEPVDVVSFLVISAYEFVEVDDVALESPSQGAADGGEILVGGRPDAVIVLRELVCFRLIQRLKQTPDVGLLRLGRAVAGAIGEKDDFFGHGFPHAYSVCLCPPTNSGLNSIGSNPNMRSNQKPQITNVLSYSWNARSNRRSRIRRKDS